MKYRIEVRSHVHDEFIDLTQMVQDLAQSSGVKEGICVLTIPHTTAGLSVNENWDASVKADLLTVLDRLVPGRGDYTHVEGNAAAHVKSVLLGTSQTLIIEGGKLALGSWQGIFLAEFDGPRTRQVLVRILSDVEVP